jgi:hypothetical protein
MYVSKKQFWILEMIKGADLVPAAGGSGRYSPKDRMVVTTEAGESLAIGPADVLDFSSPEVLKVETSGRSLDIAWDGIARMDFETAAPALTYKPAFAGAERRFIGFPVGKKAG